MFDSHVHYSFTRFDENFRYLTYTDGVYGIREGRRRDVLASIRERGVDGVIEPAIMFETNERVLDLARENPGFVFPAIGVHPQFAHAASPEKRGEVIRMAREPGVVAIGETGLDFHRNPEKQDMKDQRSWFRFLLRLAHRLRLPLILHIRGAYPQAIRILRLHPLLIRDGGVVHCFNESPETAAKLLKLGFHFGIGGYLLKENEESARLTEAVRIIPLDRILLETDAPYVLPNLPDLISSKQSKKICNTSSVILAVAERIAAIKGVDVRTVLDRTEENARRLFRIPMNS